MATLPTDREILRCIYDMYEKDYPGPEKPAGGYDNDPYLPIDVSAVAAKLAISPRMLFGRLYYDLEKKHGYQKGDGYRTSVFAPKVGDRRHCVHFPYLSAILADQDHQSRKNLLSFAMSGLAIIISMGSLAVNLLSKLH